jgi:hypothetical protein
LHGQFITRGAFDALIIQRHRDVIEGVLVIDQVERLENESEEFIAVLRSYGFIEVLDGDIVESVTARIGFI